MSKKQPPKKTALSATLYAYVEESNAEYAKSYGKKKFGSHSNYVNALIAQDRGVKPHSGVWGKQETEKRAGKKSQGSKSEKQVNVLEEKTPKKSPSRKQRPSNSPNESAELYDEPMDESAFADSDFDEAY